mmetsp:Transcript_10765/g.32373  ORF Transcript_10765/g.32373 Transcript_10765/m.32373 type:complete len:91 (+) Transcript_10765:87-359(+)
MLSYLSRTRIPLRRRSTDMGLYLVTSVVSVVAGVYIWSEPLRQLRLERLAEDGGAEGGTVPHSATVHADTPAPPRAPIPEHLQQRSKPSQ